MMENVQFTDPETNETVSFYVLEQTQLNGIKYLFVTEEEEGDGDAYILKEIHAREDGEILYEMVEDDVELSALGKVFSELMDEDTRVEF